MKTSSSVNNAYVVLYLEKDGTEMTAKLKEGQGEITEVNARKRTGQQMKQLNKIGRLPKIRTIDVRISYQCEKQ